MYSNDPEIPHENGLNGANGCTIADFTKGSCHPDHPDQDRGGSADRDFSHPARRAAPSEGKTDPRYPSLFSKSYSV
jgi:hypothetical protein